MMAHLSQRHPTTRHYLDQLADCDHLPESLRWIATEFHGFCERMVERLNDGIELSAMLHLMRDAKDAAVRQHVADRKE